MIIDSVTISSLIGAFKQLAYPFSPKAQEAQGPQGVPDFLRSFQNYQTNSNNPQALTFLLFLLLAILVFIAVVILTRHFLNNRVSRMVNTFHDKAEDYLKNRALLTLSNLKASSEQISVFFALMKGNDNYTAVMQNPNIFERLLADYRHQESDRHRVLVAESLRNLFKLDFNNLKLDINHTKLLPVRLKIRVYLRKGKNKADYLSMVVRNQSEFFSILPPKKNGQWIKIDYFKEVEIRVVREQDSEYQVFCQILQQTDDLVPEVVLEHSDKIFKLSARQHTRYKINVACKISRFTEINLKNAVYVNVQTKDLSKGGACLLAPKDYDIYEDDVLEVQFPGSNIKSLYAMVISANRFVDETGIILNVRFQDPSVANTVLIERFIKSNLQTNNTGT